MPARKKRELTEKEAETAARRGKFIPGLTAGDIVNAQSAPPDISTAARDRLARNLLGFNIVDPVTGEEILIPAGKPGKLPRN